MKWGDFTAHIHETKAHHQSLIKSQKETLLWRCTATNGEEGDLLVRMDKLNITTVLQMRKMKINVILNPESFNGSTSFLQGSQKKLLPLI